MSTDFSTYEGTYPPPTKWLEEHRDDETVSFVFGIDLGDLIDVYGIEGMNDFMDATLGLDGLTLTDIRYYQHPANPGDDIGDLVLIRAEGVLEEN